MYMMYENPQTNHPFPVKASFQWMTFLAPPNWAWIRGMTNLGWIYFIYHRAIELARGTLHHTGYLRGRESWGTPRKASTAEWI